VFQSAASFLTKSNTDIKNTVLLYEVNLALFSGGVWLSQTWLHSYSQLHHVSNSATSQRVNEHMQAIIQHCVTKLTACPWWLEYQHQYHKAVDLIAVDWKIITISSCNLIWPWTCIIYHTAISWQSTCSLVSVCHPPFLYAHIYPDTCNHIVSCQQCHWQRGCKTVMIKHKLQWLRSTFQM